MRSVVEWQRGSVDTVTETDPTRLKEALNESTRQNRLLQNAVLDKDQELALANQKITSFYGGNKGLLDQSVANHKDLLSESMRSERDDDEITVLSDDETILGNLSMREQTDKVVKDKKEKLKYLHHQCSIAPRPIIQGEGMSGVYRMVEEMRQQIDIRMRKTPSGIHKRAVTGPQVLGAISSHPAKQLPKPLTSRWHQP